MIMQSLPLLVLKLGDAGPEPIYYQLEGVVSPEEHELFLLKIGAFYLSIIGQGQEKFLGLFGPLPVAGLAGWQSYVFSFQLLDESLQDHRLENIAYCLLVMLFSTSELDEINLLRNHLEILLKKFLGQLRSVSEITESTMVDLQNHIQQLRQEFSVEKNDYQVIIRKKVEHSILATKKHKIEAIISNLSKKKLHAIVLAENDLFLRTLASMLIELVSKWDEDAGIVSLMNDLVIFTHVSPQNIKKAAKTIKHGDVIIGLGSKDQLTAMVPSISNIIQRHQSLALGIMTENQNSRQDSTSTVSAPDFNDASKELMTEILPADLIFSRPFIIYPVDFSEHSIISFILTILELVVQ